MSDHVSHNKIAYLLQKYSGEKKLLKTLCSRRLRTNVIAEPQSVPEEMRGSAVRFDVWFIVNGSQGQHKFWSPISEVHNHLFQI